MVRLPETYRAPDTDRLLTARLMGAAKRHVHWREPTHVETDATVPQLREIAGDRPDLLAEVAGIGASGGRQDGIHDMAAKPIHLAQSVIRLVAQ